MSRLPAPRRPALRLLPGGPRGLQWRALQVAAAPEDRPPFPVEAMAFEEDTFLVLSAPTDLDAPVEHPVRLFTALWEAEPRRPGTVLAQAGPPLRLLAVVHDLEAEPTWREEWIAQALTGVFAEAARRRLRSLGLQRLGCHHGHLPEERFVPLLAQALAESGQGSLERLWLITGSGGGEGLLAALGRELAAAGQPPPARSTSGAGREEGEA